MTEDEAKQKWCPMVRHGICNESGFAGGGNVAHGDNSNCIASDCMMWRWDEWTLDKNQRVTDEGISGHCGLGGFEK